MQRAAKVIMRVRTSAFFADWPFPPPGPPFCRELFHSEGSVLSYEG